MRMFVAVVPPAEALEDLSAFLEPRREAGRDLRWTVPEQWHLTLAFLDQVADRHVEDLLDRLGRAAGRRTPMGLQVAGGGAFPAAGRAKVLFAGVQPGPGAAAGAPEELRRLAVGARTAAARAGADPDGGRFRPHLTLARSGRPVEATRWLRVLDTYRGPGFEVEEIVLFASHLGEGPRRRHRHEVVATLPLGAPG